MPGIEGPYAHFISARLAMNELASVKNLVVAETSTHASMGPDGLAIYPMWTERTSYSHTAADVLWRRSEFPNANHWLHCWAPDMREGAAFSAQLRSSTPGGALNSVTASTVSSTATRINVS